MAGYTVIPGALAKIQVTLGELKIQPLNPKHTPERAVRDQARFYMTPVLNRRKQLVWFKASLQQSPWLRRGLREEVRVQKAFADYEKLHKLHFDSPSFVAGDSQGPFQWLLRRYWDGIYAGDMVEQFGYTRFFLHRVSPTLLSQVLSEVRQMTPFMKRRINLGTHDRGWYLLDFHYYREHFLTPLLKHEFNPGWKRDDLDRLEEIFHVHRPFFLRHATYFTHGDFYPNNIMVRPGAKKKVVLFDWELSHLNLPTFDPVMAYLQAWRRPSWQREFKGAVFKDLGQPTLTNTAWRLTMLSLGIRLAGFCFIRLANLQPERYPRLSRSHRKVLEPLYWRWMKEVNAAYKE